MDPGVKMNGGIRDGKMRLQLIAKGESMRLQVKAGISVIDSYTEEKIAEIISHIRQEHPKWLLNDAEAEKLEDALKLAVYNAVAKNAINEQLGH